MTLSNHVTVRSLNELIKSQKESCMAHISELVYHAGASSSGESASKL